MSEVNKNLHTEYWSYLIRQIWTWICRHKKLTGTFCFVLVLLFLTSLGVTKYIPEINSPIGKFLLTVVGETPAESQKLGKSIFLEAFNLMNSQKTSNQKVQAVQTISGLHTRPEIGEIQDVWTDGLTLVLRGVGNSGETSHIACSFDSIWQKKLDTYTKGDRIHFEGIVSNLDRSSGLIVVNNCEILPNQQEE